MRSAKSHVGLAVRCVAILAVASCKSPGTNGAPTLHSLTAVGWGGSTQAALDKTMFQPFAQKSGDHVDQDTFDGSMAQLQSATERKPSKWDVVEVETATAISGSSMNLEDPVPASVASTPSLQVASTQPGAVGLFKWWTALAWNKDRIPKGVPPPKTWADFWDLRKYPGPRGLRKDPKVTLEIALLADGVAPSKLYPIDVDRALRKLDQIRSAIVWWATGAESQTRLLQTYTMEAAWNGRIYPMIKSGDPVSMSMVGALADRDWWIVPQTSGHKADGWAFVAFTLRPEVQAAFCEATGYGPVVDDAFPLLSPGLRQYLPTPQDPTIVDYNAKWWAENEGRVREKWEKWLAGNP